jgi:hypothetical protein
MPHLAFHMSVARDLANLMGNSLIDAERGPFYLGSTGPDMHVLSRTDRMSSHYFDLDCLEDQDSRVSFFDVHGELRDASALDDGTIAFVAGYLSHLVIDEVWITDIYRPFFGSASPLHGDARANLLDRILQYDFDLQRRLDRAAIEEVLRDLASARLPNVTFLDAETLGRWRDIVVDMVSQPPNWGRFGRTASRFLAAAGVQTAEEIEAFSKALPALLEETKAHVGAQRLDDFLNKAHAVALRSLEDYLL